MNRKESGFLVKTSNGKTGMVKHSEIPKDKDEKLKVYILDDSYNQTGEKLLCTRESLTTIGMVN